MVKVEKSGGEYEMWYGILKDIIEITYPGGKNYVLFKCDWADTNKGCKKDRLKFTLVNFKKLYKTEAITDEPFIFTAQANQVWYSQDPKERDWEVVVTTSPRDNYGVYSDFLESELFAEQIID